MSGRWTVALMLGLFLADESFTAPAVSSIAKKTVMTVLVRDTVGLDDEIKRVAKAQATRIMSDAGIDLQWIDVGGFENPHLRESLNSYLTIVIALQPPKGWTKPDVMGFAPARTGPHPRAYVFTTLIDAFLHNFKASDRWSFAVVLGHVIVHEMGHLLIPGDAHGTGIMRSTWSFPEWQQALEGSLLFASTHAKILRLPD